jgi:hemoglobin-like flavoprotein
MSVTRTAQERAEAIEASLEIATYRSGDLTARVYALLFAREPRLCDLFWRDTDGAIKGEMLMKVIEATLDFIGERRYADHLIGAEAANHDAFGVPRATFATFFGVLAEVVRESCGSGWTAAMEGAWRLLLDDLGVYVGCPIGPAATAIGHG